MTRAEMASRDGWAFPDRARRFHFFSGDRSLCDRHARPPLTHPAPPASEEACVECWNDRYVARRIAGRSR